MSVIFAAKRLLFRLTKRRQDNALAIFSRRLPAWFVLTVSGVGPMACGFAPPQRADPRAQLLTCSDEESQRCGTIKVPLAPRKPSDESLQLNVRVVPAADRGSSRAPVFMLAGGPGQSAFALSEVITPIIGRMFSDRDIVFLEQRGTGEKPALSCQDNKGEIPEVGLLFENQAAVEREFKKCVATLVGDPANYLTADFVEDLEVARLALGYNKIVLLGGSYGTRSGLAYLRRYPENVEAVVFDGAAPPALNLATSPGVDGIAAIFATVQACQQDAACNQAFPDLSDRLTQVLSALAQASPAVELSNPWSGRPQLASVSAGSLLMQLFKSSYSATTSAVLPYVIDAASRADYRPLLGIGALGAGGEHTSMAFALFATVACNEDYHQLSAAEQAKVGDGPFDQAWRARMRMLCEAWPHVPVPDPNDGVSAKVDVPMLVLSGELDPVTPPKWGELMAEYSQQSQHVVLRGTGHGCMQVPCGQQLIGDFLAAPGKAQLDLACAESGRRSPFWIDAFGP